MNKNIRQRFIDITKAPWNLQGFSQGMLGNSEEEPPLPEEILAYIESEIEKTLEKDGSS